MWLSTKLFGLKEYILEMYTEMRRIISVEISLSYS